MSGSSTIESANMAPADVAMARGMGALRKRNRDRLLSDDSAVNRRIREYGGAPVPFLLGRRRQ